MAMFNPAMATGPSLDGTPRGDGRRILIVDDEDYITDLLGTCLLYTSPSPRDRQKSRMPSSA